MSPTISSQSCPHAVENKLLKVLECKDNGLTLLPEGEWGLLTHLNAMKNILVAVPSTMGTWGQLRHLNFSENKIGELPADIGNCFSMCELHMTGNELTSLPESFANLTNMKILNLGRNHLKNDALQLMVNMTQLERLFLYKNKFTTIPVEFGEFKSMTVFSIANNMVKSIPGRLGCWADAVVEAHFSHNDIAEVPMSLGSWYKLKEVSFGFNVRLQTIPKSLAEIRGLLQMDLREVNPEFVLPKELQTHPRCQFKGIKIKGKGKKKKK